MPITNIHEEVALNISNKYKYLNNNDFYLGNYAPDSVNLNGLAEKNLRWTAHQRKNNLNDWRKSIKEFYQKEKNSYSKEFLLGYITHILTDIIYDDLFYDDVTKLIKIDYPHSTDTHSIMGEDMKKYVYNSKYKNEITTILNSINTYYNILNITDEMMEAFKNKVLKEEYNIDNSIYINEELIVKLSQQVMNELKEYIED